MSLMRYSKSSIVALLLVQVAFAIDPISEADYLIITHPQLDQGTWLTDFINLQTDRGFHVGVLMVQDQVTTNTDIRDSIALAYNTGVPVKYVLLVGAAAHQEPETPPEGKQETRDLRIDVVDASRLNFIPFTYETMEIWLQDTIDVPTDDHYISDLEGHGDIYIGRIPARNSAEVSSWLEKLNAYYASYDSYASWKNREIMISQNVTNPWNDVPGHKVNWMYDDVLPYINTNVEVSFLRATDIDSAHAWGTNNGVYPLVEPFESAVNEGSALMHFFGTGADADNIGNFYFFDDIPTCDFQFTNQGQYPYFLGISCTLGGIQYPTTKPCVLQKMMFIDRGGLIGFYAPTIITTQWGCREFSEDLHRLLFQEGVNVAGELTRKTKTNFEPRMSSQVWESRGFVNYGDPSMPIFVYQHIDTDITSNVTWQGNLVVESSIGIQAGDTLTIKPGTGIFFKPGTRLRVYGHLEARGTDAFPIVFGPADSANHDNLFWTGITVYSPGSFHLEHVRINGARFGLYANYASGIIETSRFEEDYYGVYLYQSANTIISNCTFFNNRYGTYASYSSPGFSSNHYADNAFGIMLNRSTGKLAGNVISGSLYDGLYCTNMSSPYLSTTRPDDGTMPEVNNSIIANSRYGVYIDNNSTPDLGTYFYRPGRYYAGGFNEFAPSSRSYDIKSEYPRIIKAELNWWNELRILGNVDTDPTANRVFGGMAKTLVSTGADLDSLASILLVADSLVLDSAFSEAISLLQDVIAGAPDDPLAVAAINRIVRLYTRLDDLSSLYDNLELIRAQYPELWAGICATDHLVTLASHAKDFLTALAWSEEVIDAYQARNSTEAVAWALFEQGSIFENISIMGSNLGKNVPTPDELQARAEAVYQRLLRDYPHTAAAYFLREFRGEASPPPEGEASLPTAYRLYPAYPNPFNPRTTIEYDLPEAGQVTLSVYDLLGREIAVLVQGYQAAGYHRTTWTGQDNRGLPVATGVYLYRLTTPRYTAVGKVLLLR